MPVTKISSRSRDLGELLRYVENPEKTDDGYLVSSIGCFFARDAMKTIMETRKDFRKEKGVLAYHIIQNFQEGTVNPGTAHEIGLLLAKEYLDDYITVVATHIDQRCIHNHIVFGAVSDLDGHMYHPGPPWVMLQEIRAVSDRLCEERGILEAERNQPAERSSYLEQKLQKEGRLSFKELFALDAKEVRAMSESSEDFFRIMEKRGYTAMQDFEGVLLFQPEGQKWLFRLTENETPVTEPILDELLEEQKNRPMEQETKRFDLPFRYRAITDIQMLYKGWIEVLERIGSGEKPAGPVHISYQELKKINPLKKQAEYLKKHKILTAGDLAERISGISRTLEQDIVKRAELWEMRKEGEGLDKALKDLDRYREAAEEYQSGAVWRKTEYTKYQKAQRRLAGCDTEQLWKERDGLRGRIADLNTRIRKGTEELKLCEQIREEGKSLFRKYREMDERMYPERIRERSLVREPERIRERSYVREMER